MRVILSCKKIKARNAVDTGKVSISRAALLASDMRVPQVISTWPGNTPTTASKRKTKISLVRQSRFSLFFASNLSNG
jgi:hypothetical protein